MLRQEWFLIHMKSDKTQKGRGNAELGEGCIIFTKIQSCEKTKRPAVLGLCGLGQVIHLAGPPCGHRQNGAVYACLVRPGSGGED